MKGKRRRGSKKKILVFDILERAGKVKVEIIKDVKVELLLKETIKKLKEEVFRTVEFLLALVIGGGCNVVKDAIRTQ